LRTDYALRLQPEGEMSTTTAISDQVKATSILDRPEHGRCFTNDEVDNYLPIASANHMTGNPWYSTECCAALNMNYAQTLQDVTIRMHRSYAGGSIKSSITCIPIRRVIRRNGRDTTTLARPGFQTPGSA